MKYSQRKKVFPVFLFEAKITNLKRSEKFEAKKSEKMRKNRPKFLKVRGEFFGVSAYNLKPLA